MLIKIKIRFTFDCSCQHRGTKMNGILFSGPDLTNHLASVLNRLSLGRLASMITTQAMFYQVKVPEQQRLYNHRILGFLLWNDDILNLEK